MNIIKSALFVELEPGLEATCIFRIDQRSSGKCGGYCFQRPGCQRPDQGYQHGNQKLSLSMREAARKRKTGRFNRFEKPEGFEQKDRPQKREKSDRTDRPSRGSNRGARRDNIDRGYQDKADNLTIGDLFGDLKAKMNFGDDEE